MFERGTEASRHLAVRACLGGWLKSDGKRGDGEREKGKGRGKRAERREREMGKKTVKDRDVLVFVKDGEK